MTLAQHRTACVASSGDGMTADEAREAVADLDELIALHGPDWQPPTIRIAGVTIVDFDDVLAAMRAGYEGGGAR
jgi:hypothetical protein